MSFPSLYTVNSNLTGLLNDYFNIGNLTAKLKSNKVVNLEIGVDQCCKSSNLELDVQSKLIFDKYKIEIIKRFSSSNVLSLECCVRDLFTKNSGHHFSMTNDFSVGHRQAQMKNYKHGDKYHGGVDLKFISDRPIITVHGLAGYEDYFLGGQATLDTHEKTATFGPTHISIGYSVPDFTFQGLTVLHNKRASYEASLYARVSDSLQLGAQFSWERDNGSGSRPADPRVTLCGQVELDPASGTFVRARVTNLTTVAVAYGLQVVPGVQVALSGESNRGAVQFGLAVAAEMD